MKVVFLNTYDRGGGAIAALRLAEALDTLAVGVKVLVNKGASTHPLMENIDKSEWRQFRNSLNFYAERLSFLPYEESKEIRFLFSPANFGVEVHKIKEVQDADIIHLHWVNQGLLSHKTMAKLTKLNKPIVWTLHDKWAFTGGCHITNECTNFYDQCGNCWYLKNSNPKDLSHKIWKKKSEVYPKLDLHFVTPSKFQRSEAHKSSLLRDYDIAQIPNPLDVNQFRPRSKEQARTILNLPPDKDLILFGALNTKDRHKGFVYLKECIDILKKYDHTLNDPELVVFGKANEEELNALPLKVHYLGVLSDVKTINWAYNAADIFITPSLEDNLPNMVMEAMACATPIVAFRTGGIPEMVEHLKEGYIAPQKNSEALARGIIEVLRDKTNYEAMAQSARKKVLNLYSYTNVGHQYKALYEKILDR